MHGMRPTIKAGFESGARSGRPRLPNALVLELRVQALWVDDGGPDLR
jgi:hypothetical protein